MAPKGPPRPLANNKKITNPHRQIGAGKKGGHLRDAATIKRLAMYKTKPKRNAKGDFISGDYMSTTPDERIKRIAPNRKWFTNTRVVGQKELDTFREEMSNAVNDPYKFVMKSKTLPMGLLSNPFKNAKMNLLTTETFEDTFGGKAQRKRPRMGNGKVNDLSSLMKHVESQRGSYEEEKDTNVKEDGDGMLTYMDRIFDKGQSRRIWGELYKVIDSSDVIIQVLDVRDPLGTRSKRIEDELKTNERRHKHLVFVLNKCDLVPTWVTRRWVKLLSKEYPTIAFHASITNPFGKGSLIQLLRQFAILHKDKKQISVGFVGYPNVGKSSVINTVRGKKVCKAAPMPGETKVWQYITLFRRVFLIDCPGVVYPGAGNTETDFVLKGVVRVQNLESPEDYIPAVLERVKSAYIKNTYGIESWKDPTDFMKQYAKKTGKLLKGGEPDLNNCCRKILMDWQRGRLPFFVAPPFDEVLNNKTSESAKVEEEEINEDTSDDEEEEEMDGKKKKLRAKKNESIKSLPQVNQLFHKIPVKLKFSEEKEKRDGEDQEEDDVVDYDEMYAEKYGEEITSVLGEEVDADEKNEAGEGESGAVEKEEDDEEEEEEDVEDHTDIHAVSKKEEEKKKTHEVTPFSKKRKKRRRGHNSQVQAKSGLEENTGVLSTKMSDKKRKQKKQNRIRRKKRRV